MVQGSSKSKRRFGQDCRLARIRIKASAFSEHQMPWVIFMCISFCNNTLEFGFNTRFFLASWNCCKWHFPLIFELFLMRRNFITPHFDLVDLRSDPNMQVVPSYNQIDSSIAIPRDTLSLNILTGLKIGRNHSIESKIQYLGQRVKVARAVFRSQ